MSKRQQLLDMNINEVLIDETIDGIETWTAALLQGWNLNYGESESVNTLVTMIEDLGVEFGLKIEARLATEKWADERVVYRGLIS